MSINHFEPIDWQAKEPIIAFQRDRLHLRQLVAGRRSLLSRFLMNSLQANCGVVTGSGATAAYIKNINNLWAKLCSTGLRGLYPKYDS